MAEADLRRSATQEARDALAVSTGLRDLSAGAPNRAPPVSAGIPGRDIPEMRVDGIPVVSPRWPETAHSPLPLLAIGEVALRRYAPICGPLSSTGGARLDLSLFPPVADRAVSAMRLTQGSYATYTDEMVLRRPLGPVLFRGYYGDSKSDGRYLLGRQTGQTIGLRAGRAIAGGWADWGYEDATYRARQLATKRVLWDRTVWSLRFSRPDSATIHGEAAVYWRSDRGRWETAQGATERRGRAVGIRLLAERSGAAGAFSAAAEIEGSRTRFVRPEVESRSLEDLSIGLAAGYGRAGTGWASRLSAGVVRHDPLAAAFVFSAEWELDSPGFPALLAHASRAVRHRALPRLPTDGGAWVRQGIDLVPERDGEAPEALWRGAIEIANRRRPGGSEIRLGLDALLDAGGLDPALDDLAPLGVDAQDALAPEQLRRDAWFLSPWIRTAAALPLGLRLEAEVAATEAEGTVARHLGLAAFRWDGRLGRRALLFREDLDIDLRLCATGRTEAATPYGTLPAVGMLDGEIHARIGSADLFLVMGNLTNVEQRSMSYDGGFMILPLRHYRAGIAWTFLD